MITVRSVETSPVITVKSGYGPTIIEELTVNPSVEEQIITPSGDVNGFSPVKVNPVKLNDKIITENGIYNAQDDNLTGYSSVKVVVPSSGGSQKGFFDKATQTLIFNNAYIVDLIDQATSEQIKEHVLSAVGNKDVIFDLTDVQLFPGSDKYVCWGTNIFVEGNPVCAIMDMSGGNYSVTITEGVACLNDVGLSITGVTLEQIIQMGGAVDENVFTITGTQGNYDVVFNEPKEYEKKYGADVNNFLGDVDANGVLQVPTEQVDLVFTGVEDLGRESLSYKFYKNINLKSVTFPDLISVSGDNALEKAFQVGSLPSGQGYMGFSSFSFPKLETISGYHAFENTFSGNYALTSVSFPKLKTVSGVGGLYQVFNGCTFITSASFPELTTISGSQALCYLFNNCQSLASLEFPKLSVLTGSQAFYYTFNLCRNLQSVSFPALTSQSFGSYTNQFSRMLNSVTGCTVHFPSNLQSVIGSWGDVQNGFGGTNTTVLFDLPATE